MAITSSPGCQSVARRPTDDDAPAQLHAGDLVVHRRAGVEAAALQEVGPVERGGHHLDQHLLGPGLGIGHVSQREHVGLAVGLEDHRSHGRRRYCGVRVSSTRRSPSPSGSRACRWAGARTDRPGPSAAAPCSRPGGPARARRARRRRAGRPSTRSWSADGDHRHHLLAVALVGHADDQRVEDGGMALEHVLDLLGEDLLAAGVDRRRAPPEHGDGAVVLEPGQIAGHRPAHAVDHRERGRAALVVAVVAERDPARAGQPSHLARRHRREVVVEHGGVLVGHEAGPPAAAPVRRRPWPPVSDAPKVLTTVTCGSSSRSWSTTAVDSTAPPDAITWSADRS